MVWNSCFVCTSGVLVCFMVAGVLQYLCRDLLWVYKVNGAEGGKYQGVMEERYWVKGKERRIEKQGRENGFGVDSFDIDDRELST